MVDKSSKKPIKKIETDIHNIRSDITELKQKLDLLILHLHIEEDKKQKDNPSVEHPVEKGWFIW